MNFLLRIFPGFFSTVNLMLLSTGVASVRSPTGSSVGSSDTLGLISSTTRSLKLARVIGRLITLFAPKVAFEVREKVAICLSVTTLTCITSPGTESGAADAYPRYVAPLDNSGVSLKTSVILLPSCAGASHPEIDSVLDLVRSKVNLPFIWRGCPSAVSISSVTLWSLSPSRAVPSALTVNFTKVRM